MHSGLELYDSMSPRAATAHAKVSMIGKSFCNDAVSSQPVDDWQKSLYGQHCSLALLAITMNTTWATYDAATRTTQ